jgi:hypothetical protein
MHGNMNIKYMFSVNLYTTANTEKWYYSGEPLGREYNIEL